MSKCLCLFVILLAAGCSTYRERFTYFGANGQTNHVVDVYHKTFLMWGQAAQLKTETQTSEFIRTVNAQGLLLKPDAESVKSLTEGLSKGVIEGLKAANGVP